LEQTALAQLATTEPELLAELLHFLGLVLQPYLEMGAVAARIG
jgi:hypothetical protein